MPAGAEEELWLSLLEHVVLPAAVAFEPDLVLISAGFDAHLEDPLANCRLQTASFAEMARHVRDMALAADIPLGAVLEGGYNQRVLAECVPETLAALGGEGQARSAGAEPPTASGGGVPDPALGAASPQSLISRAAAHVGRYWPL